LKEGGSTDHQAPPRKRGGGRHPLLFSISEKTQRRRGFGGDEPSAEGRLDTQRWGTGAWTDRASFLGSRKAEQVALCYGRAQGGFKKKIDKKATGKRGHWRPKGGKRCPGE